MKTTIILTVLNKKTNKTYELKFKKHPDLYEISQKILDVTKSLWIQDVDWAVIKIKNKVS